MKSKGRRLFLCLMASIMAMGTKAQESVQTESVGTLDLNLERAIEIALAENPTIKVADKDIELKKVADKEAWQALLPEVNVTGNLQHTILATEMKLGGEKFKMGKDNANTVAAVATLSIPLFAPTIYQNMKLTKTDIKLAQEKARSSRLDLIKQVSKAYYQALLAKDSYEVMQKSFKTSKQNYEVVEKKFNVGRVSEYDKITAEVQMRSMNSSLVSAQNGLTLAELQLKVLMGINTDIKVVIDDKLENYENGLKLADVDASEAALENNAAIRQLDLNRTMLERTLKIQRTGFMPNVAFSLTGQYQSLQNDNWRIWNYDWSPSASFTIAVSIPIFRASNWTKLKSTKLQLSSLEDTKANTQRQLVMAAQNYMHSMASSIAQVNSNREAITKADKALSIAKTRYDVGRGTILELNQSEVALTQAQLTYNQSIYDYLRNKADLDYTLGRETYLR